MQHTLTPIQERVLVWISGQRYRPTSREVGRGIGVVSAGCSLRALERMGMITLLTVMEPHVWVLTDSGRRACELIKHDD